jgi:hypothetical protein
VGVLQKKKKLRKIVVGCCKEVILKSFFLHSIYLSMLSFVNLPFLCQGRDFAWFIFCKVYAMEIMP